ncbi:MAG: PTS sugar transporter subunit IIA, partial [Candidatus Heimdallarchaeota archaeon]|nr:PTS sugar transporter subunit IIA [Candidatus Heimdallarchaeota archaeon]
KHASQHSALIYVLEKLVAKDKELSTDSLLTELREIVIERDNIPQDRFHNPIKESIIMDIEEPLEMKSLFMQISEILGEKLNMSPFELLTKFIERETQSSTIIRDGLAIPHIIIEREYASRIILVRAKAGIIFPNDRIVHVAFVLVGASGKQGPSIHLKDLAAIAQIANNKDFDEKWLEAKNEDELRSILLLAERYRYP